MIHCLKELPKPTPVFIKKDDECLINKVKALWHDLSPFKATNTVNLYYENLNGLKHN